MGIDEIRRQQQDLTRNATVAEVQRRHAKIFEDEFPKILNLVKEKASILGITVKTTTLKTVSAFLSLEKIYGPSLTTTNAYESSIILPGTKMGLRIETFKYGEFYKDRAGHLRLRWQEKQYQPSTGLTADVAADIPVLPIYVRFWQENIWRACGYLWRGQEDNNHIAQAIVSILTTGKPEHQDFNPKPRCFIASSIFGEAAEEVRILRDFRDESLCKWGSGRFLIELYNKFAPRFVSVINSSPLIRTVIKTVLSGLVCILSHYTKTKTNRGVS